MAKPVPIILLLLIVCANHLLCEQYDQNSINQLDEELIKQLDNEINALVSKRTGIERQGLMGGGFLGGPLALAALVFGLRNLPTILMTPLAIAGIRPTINTVGQFMNSIGGLNGGAHIAQNIASLLAPPASLSAQQSASSGSGSDSSSSSSSSSTNSGSTSSFGSAIRSISDLIFNRRNSQSFFTRFPIKAQVAQTEQNSEPKPGSTSTETAQNRIMPLVSSLREVYGILRNGLRRYEITDSDCQSRIICELHQKTIGHSGRSGATLGSLTAHMLDLIGLESQLDRSSAFNDRAKAFIKDFIRAAKTGISNRDCSSVFSRCPAVPELPQMNAISALNPDYFKLKPNIFDLQQKSVTGRANRKAWKSFVTNPRTAAYFLNTL